jgi:hypothetical protein
MSILVTQWTNSIGRVLDIRIVTTHLELEEDIMSDAKERAEIPVMQLDPGLPDGPPPGGRVVNNTSATLILNTGAPQGCMLCPLLYSLFTHLFPQLIRYLS